MHNEIILSPDNIPVLSKTNAATFHAQAKERIFDNGGAFEYVEVIKFFSALDKQITGDSASKIEPDKEFIDYLREEIRKHGNGGDKAEYKTLRGVKFTLAETGTAYNFSMCNDPELSEMEKQEAEIKEKVKARKEFLKTIPVKGIDIITSDGEAIKIYPPSKTSKSSFKIQLPK